MNNYITVSGHTFRISKTLRIKLLKQKLRSLTMKCGFAVHAYAHAIHDFELMKKASAAYGLYRVKDARLQDACEAVYQLAKAHLDAAGQYGYTTDDVNELKTQLDEHSLYVQEVLKTAQTKKLSVATNRTASGWNKRAI